MAFRGILTRAGMIFAGVRRRRTDGGTAPAVAPAEPASRSRRRAALGRMGEDPIIAAMGIGSDVAPDQRAGASRTGSGPGERESGTGRS